MADGFMFVHFRLHSPALTRLAKATQMDSQWKPECYQYQNFAACLQILYRDLLMENNRQQSL